MQTTSILYPVFLLVFLTFAITIWMGILRFRAVARQELSRGYFKHNRGGKPPERLMSVTQNFENLLETPILFYTVVLFLLQQNAVTEWSITLAWLYTGLRYLHSLVHTTYNHVLHRFFVFLLSLVVLGMLWGQLIRHMV
jgi:hypothetical protein